MKVLIVDEQVATRELIKEFIGHLATDIVEYDSAEATMRHCLDSVPDLIILDLRIGQIDGLAVLAFVRNVCPSVHVIALTQYDDAELQLLAKREGAARYFSKSNLAAMRDYVVRWLNRNRDSAVPRLERVQP